MMLRPILAASLLTGAIAVSLPGTGQAQFAPQSVDCIATGKLQITHIGRNQMTGGEGGGLAISVLIYNPQNTSQRFSITYTGGARNKVTNQERNWSAYMRQTEWVATVTGGSSITDQQIRNNVQLRCY
ncbi:hypothetical protein [Roseococcus sp. YIM B11640]|uniref:hypothetical protein n=1 Tax=Roseococcus sp. YIM B11640 TaxID=3133973 RepID=UPI003C7AD69A